MKTWMLILLLPFFSAAQTIHRKGDKIVYQEDVPLPGRSSQDVLAQLRSLAGPTVKKGKGSAQWQATDSSVSAIGDIKLTASYPMLRTVNYSIELTAREGGYAYRIDSVYVTERKRGGGGETVKKDNEMLEGMQQSGPSAEAAERLLNEIDMNFQKLLAVIRLRMIKGTGTTP